MPPSPFSDLVIVILLWHSDDLCPYFPQFEHFPLKHWKAASTWSVSNCSSDWRWSQANFKLSLFCMSWTVSRLEVLPKCSSSLLTWTLYSLGSPFRTWMMKSSLLMPIFISISLVQIDSSCEIHQGPPMHLAILCIETLTWVQAWLAPCLVHTCGRDASRHLLHSHSCNHCFCSCKSIEKQLSHLLLTYQWTAPVLWMPTCSSWKFPIFPSLLVWLSQISCCPWGWG